MQECHEVTDESDDGLISTEAINTEIIDNVQENVSNTCEVTDRTDGDSYDELQHVEYAIRCGDTEVKQLFVL